MLNTLSFNLTIRGHTEVVSVEEARDIWKKLNELFKPRDGAPQLAYQVPMYPYTPPSIDPNPNGWQVKCTNAPYTS